MDSKSIKMSLNVSVFDFSANPPTLKRFLFPSTIQILRHDHAIVVPQTINFQQEKLSVRQFPGNEKRYQFPDTLS